MEIILTHNNMDFDGLAAVCAARKLYPRAVAVLPGHLHRNVQEFMALHKDSLDFKPAGNIPPDQVTRVIMVDFKSPVRAGLFGGLLRRPDVDVHIYDHHPDGADDILGSVMFREDVGAVTTLMVELLQQREVKPTPFEATLFALGIYEDTGCLTYASTTARDAAAVAYLLSCGANLALVADFIGRPLSAEQKMLLEILLRDAQVHLIRGVKVVAAVAAVGEYINGLSAVVHMLAEVESPDVCFVAVKMANRVHVVGRSRLGDVQVNELLQPLGGGGHGAAAAATVKGGEPDEILQDLLQVLHQIVRPQVTAREIMSSPVKTLTPETTVAEAGRVMLRYGHTGLPVVAGDEMVGIISRRDLDKAYLHGLGHAPVKGFMSTRVTAISPETSLREIQHLMITRDIGRLPVIATGRLVGIVSRTDVLRTIHGENAPAPYWTNYPHGPAAVTNGHVRQMGSLLQERLPVEIGRLFKAVSRLAAANGVKVYVVGGFVRDLLLGVQNLDIDLVVEGDGIRFATALARFLAGHLTVHGKFGTAVILWGKQRIDVATARQEFYQYPAALPQVEAASLHQDLYRRDFTINALAIELTPGHFGELVDFFNGCRDLEQGLIRVLYNLSFVEDPTRIFRAIRFEQRYGFKIEPETLRFARESIRQGLIRRLSPERLFAELMLILSEEQPVAALRRLTELELWADLLPEFRWTEELAGAVTSLPALLRDLATAGLEVPERRWPVYLLILARGISPAGAAVVAERYPLKGWLREAVRQLAGSAAETAAALNCWLKQAADLSVLEKILRNWPVEALLALRAGEPVRQTMLVMQAWQQVRQTKPLLTGGDLKKAGIPPGPLYAAIFQRLRRECLAGKVTDRRGEWRLVREVLTEKGYDHPEEAFDV
ncbi:MAG: CBS domain-containing protein [Heliobacteriaceae bacterium]|nr:CBS domain-containing protein [Heliobacteriaceae bacterium]